MLSTRVHSCPGCGKRMTSTHGLTRHMNTCTSQQVLPICMQPKQDTPIPGEDENTSDNFGLHENEESILEEQDIEGDHRNLVGDNSDTKSHARDGLSQRIPQDGLFGSELSSSLKEVRFSKQEFPAGIPVSNIKYQQPSSQNDNLFHLFNDQLDNAFATYFVESETTKGNVDRFLSNL